MKLEGMILREVLIALEGKGFLRVKIKLRKEEVTQLMSKCDGCEEGVLKEVVKQLKRIRADHLGVVDHRGPPWRPVLETILESSYIEECLD